jgi:hypothetical protein
VQASVVQIGQLVQNSHKMNGNGAKWKQLVDRAEADRQTQCKFLDRQVLFTGYFTCMQQHTKEMRDSFQSSSKELGQGDVFKQNKTNTERETETLKMSAA